MNPTEFERRKLIDAVLSQVVHSIWTDGIPPLLVGDAIANVRDLLYGKAVSAHTFPGGNH